MTPSLAEAALAVAVRGWPVFPCRADKRPACWHGCKDATTDGDAIRRLFKGGNAALIAIATGEPSGIVAIDTDPAAFAWFEPRRNHALFPPTRAHRTPRGGWHLLYRRPAAGLRCSIGKLARGADIRGDGGYLVIPPSSGYTVIDEREPAPFPAWILAALARIDETRARKAALRPAPEPGDIAALHRFVAASRDGERNSRLFWAACRAGEHATELMSAAQRTGLAATEARATILSAMRTAGKSRR
jgi:hypothetical protein